MAPRLRAKLGALAGLAKEALPGVRVLFGPSFRLGMHGQRPTAADYGDLVWEGRETALTIAGATEDQMRVLSQLAVCAGFDHVERVISSLVVAVRKQHLLLSQTESFASAQLLEVFVKENKKKKKKKKRRRSKEEEKKKKKKEEKKKKKRRRKEENIRRRRGGEQGRRGGGKGGGKGGRKKNEQKEKKR